MADPNRHSSMYGSEAMNLRTQIDDDDKDEDVAGAEESIDNPQARLEGHVIEDRAVVVMNGVQDVHHNHLYVPGSDFAPVAAGGGGGGVSGAGGVDQLTLSFQGEVYVFDAVSPEKAVLLLLGGYEVPTGIPAPGMVPPNQRGLPDFTGRSSQPQRAASLSRFREKRKERCFDKKIRYTVRKEVALSSFTIHLGHKLSKEEVDNLTRRKWKYDWETPAFNMPSCRWMGTGESFTKDANTSSSYGLKQKLCKHWLESYKTSGGDDFHSSKQRLFFSLCNSYRDILHCNKKPFYLKGQEEDSCIMDAYIMHALNHIFRTRDLVTKNDAKVAKHQETVKEEILTGESFLDHGFTRPKVLIILPLASTALRVVKRLIQLTPSSSKVNVEHIDRFADEFGAGVVEDDKEQNELSQKVQDYENSKAQKSSKPSDFQALFGANNNDHFMIGIKFTRRTIKLYGDFYSSDMIIASPLGLITKIGEAEVEKEKDVDYLSSIEVLVIDHADVISMQNWSHANSVVEQLNRLPSKQHGTDIMRIRQWYLDGHARFYRQTIILGSYLTPDINALFNHHCVNYKGKMKLVCEYKGALAKVLLQVRQIYERFDVDSIVDSDDARFEYFTEKVFPKIKDSIQGGIMLFVSSYFEYVRIRNFLKSQNASFCLLGEYTKQSDISRARVWFFEGNRKIMLYTERAHFYHRYKIRGIQNLIIYSLPERKEFYPEIVNMLEGSHNMTCTVLFSRFDQFRLERIVGSMPAKRMVASEKNVFVFC